MISRHKMIDLFQQKQHCLKYHNDCDFFRQKCIAWLQQQVPTTLLNFNVLSMDKIYKACFSEFTTLRTSTIYIRSDIKYTLPKQIIVFHFMQLQHNMCKLSLWLFKKRSYVPNIYVKLRVRIISNLSDNIYFI